MENVILLVDYQWDNEKKRWRWYVPLTDRYGEFVGTQAMLMMQLREEIRLLNTIYQSGKRRKLKKYKSA